jgi:phage shock protein PspC (stress-responsive transcriptional regulator)/predicted membrane protein
MTDHATYRKLRRSDSDRMIWGVCGGLGEYFDVNPTFYRVGFAVLTLLGGAGLLMYAAAALVIPTEGRDDSILEDALRDQRERPWRLVGIGLAGVAAIALLSHARIWPHGDFAWILLLLAGLALLGGWRHSARADAGRAAAAGTAVAPAPAPRRRSFPPATAMLGLLVVGAGVLGALAHWGVDISWAVAFATAAVLVGATLVLAAFLRLRIGGLVFLGLLLGAAALVASTIDVHLNDGIGKRSYAPVTTASVRSSYKLGIGRLTVDLGHTQLHAGTTVVAARLGIGKLIVVVPPAMNVRVDSHVSWGDSRILGEEQNGHAVDETVVRGGHPSEPTLVLDVHVGAGSVEVDRTG